jgi:hypothetical protein
MVHARWIMYLCSNRTKVHNRSRRKFAIGLTQDFLPPRSFLIISSDIVLNSFVQRSRAGPAIEENYILEIQSYAYLYVSDVLFYISKKL